MPTDSLFSFRHASSGRPCGNGAPPPLGGRYGDGMSQRTGGVGGWSGGVSECVRVCVCRYLANPGFLYFMPPDRHENGVCYTTTQMRLGWDRGRRRVCLQRGRWSSLLNICVPSFIFHIVILHEWYRRWHRRYCAVYFTKPTASALQYLAVSAFRHHSLPLPPTWHFLLLGLFYTKFR